LSDIKSFEGGRNWGKAFGKEVGTRIDRVVTWNTYVEEKREGSRMRDNPNIPNIDAFLSID
jgi:hypothetical protein